MFLKCSVYFYLFFCTLPLATRAPCSDNLHLKPQRTRPHGARGVHHGVATAQRGGGGGVGHGGQRRRGGPAAGPPDVDSDALGPGGDVLRRDDGPTCKAKEHQVSQSYKFYPQTTDPLVKFQTLFLCPRPIRFIGNVFAPGHGTFFLGVCNIPDRGLQHW